MCDVTSDLQTLPFGKLPHFLRILPPCNVKYFMNVHKTFIKRHSVIQKCSRPNLFCACGDALPQSNPRALLMLALQIGISRFDMSYVQAHWVGSKSLHRLMQLKLHKPTMAIGYSLLMCARHVDSTNPGPSNLVFRKKPIPEAEMSNRLISLAVLANGFHSFQDSGMIHLKV